MSDGYSYAAVCARRGGPVLISASLYLDERAHIAVHSGEGDGRARLSVSMGDVSVIVGPADPDAVTREDAWIARRLADRAAAYADAVERLAVRAEGGPAAA